MWINILFWVIIIAFALIGLWRGLFESILSLVSSAIGIGVSIWLAKPFAAFLNSFLHLSKLFEEGIKKAYGSNETLPFFGHELDFKSVAAFLSIVLAGVILFFIVKLAIFLLSRVFDGATSSSNAASGLNRVLGLLFGIAQGFLINLCLLGVCVVISQVPATKDTIVDSIKQSTTTRWFYNFTEDFVSKSLEECDMDSIIEDVIQQDKADEKTESTTDDSTATE